MSTVVGDIRTAIDGIVATETTWSKLRFIEDVSKNDERNLDQAYGVRPLDAPEGSTITKVYTLDHNFEVILSRTAPREQDDDDLIAAKDDLFEQAHKVLKATIDTKLGLPAVVIVVQAPSISEPEILDGLSAIVLRVGFSVKYRQPTGG